MGGACSSGGTEGSGLLGIKEIYFTQGGLGSDMHGQDATKAATRACLDAIQSNSVLPLQKMVPVGFELAVHVRLGVPHKYRVDTNEVAKCFPIAKVVHIELTNGGLLAPAGLVLDDLGDKADEVIMIVASVTVGCAGGSVEQAGPPQGAQLEVPVIRGPLANGMNEILLVQWGLGCDIHGQNPTKAAVRACRKAILFCSCPAFQHPARRDNHKLHVLLGVPEKYLDSVDKTEVAKAFPHFSIMPIELTPGGLLAPSGITAPEMGDKVDEMIYVVACVTVGS